MSLRHLVELALVALVIRRRGALVLLAATVAIAAWILSGRHDRSVRPDG